MHAALNYAQTESHAIKMQELFRKQQGRAMSFAEHGTALIFNELDPLPRVNSCQGGFCCCVKLDSSYQLSKIAEIFWVNQQGALEKQLGPGR